MALMPSGFGGLFDPAFMFPFGRGEQRTRDPLDFSALMPSLTSVAPSMSTHPTDIVETHDAFKITVDAPGMGADDISVTVSEGVLTISGKKKHEVEDKDKEGRVLRRERAFTSFTRSFTLPAEGVKEDEVAASLKNGVLELVVPKVAPPPKPEPRRIAVHEHAGGEVPKVMQQAAVHHAGGAGAGGETAKVATHHK